MTLTLFRTSSRAIALMALMLLICFASCTNTQSANIVSLKQIRPDRSCGPRCLTALMQITGAGRPDCDIKCIYELIGKEPFGDTTLTLKDLKDAAQKLGFSANGYKLTVDDLKKITGYAILPVGNAAGTADDPQHFILVKQVVKNDVTIINTRTLKAQTIAVSDLQNAWKGYALVISWR
jgi:ABC-type bacteriocin/lantibiotic exporter with double-glycine peptidase domain